MAGWLTQSGRTAGGLRQTGTPARSGRPGQPPTLSGVPRGLVCAAAPGRGWAPLGRWYVPQPAAAALRPGRLFTVTRLSGRTYVYGEDFHGGPS